MKSQRRAHELREAQYIGGTAQPSTRESLRFLSRSIGVMQCAQVTCANGIRGCSSQSRRWRHTADMERQLPVDRALLAGVDILGGARLEKKRLHVLGEECARLRIHDVEAVVIDQHGLLLHPLRPAILADLCDDSRADGAWERRLLKSGAVLAAPDARDVRPGRTQPLRDQTAGR